MNDEGVVEARFFKRKENEVKISSNRINLRSLIFYDNSYYLNYPYKDTIFEIPALIKNKSIIFQFNRRKELTHVGISLFTEETKEMLDRNICNFLERFFLELLLQGDKTGICFKLEEYHVQMWLDGQDYAKKNLWTLANFLQIMEMPVNFSMAHNKGFAQAKWTF